MLHFNAPPVPSWHGTIAAGDVVSYRFPMRERPDAWAKARPCLVLAVEQREDGPYALLAYGTAQFTRANRGCELPLIHAPDRAAAGVDRPMRFVCARRVWARLDETDNMHTLKDALTREVSENKGYTSGEVAGGVAFYKRKERLTNPPGKFDNKQRFEASERTQAVPNVRTPSARFPYPEMKAARTAAHCAELLGVEPLATKRVARALEFEASLTDNMSAHCRRAAMKRAAAILKPLKRPRGAAAG